MGILFCHPSSGNVKPLNACPVGMIRGEGHYDWFLPVTRDDDGCPPLHAGTPAGTPRGPPLGTPGGTKRVQPEGFRIWCSGRFERCQRSELGRCGKVYGWESLVRRQGHTTWGPFTHVSSVVQSFRKGFNRWTHDRHCFPDSQGFINPIMHQATRREGNTACEGIAMYLPLLI